MESLSTKKNSYNRKIHLVSFIDIITSSKNSKLSKKHRKRIIIKQSCRLTEGNFQFYNAATIGSTLLFFIKTKPLKKII